MGFFGERSTMNEVWGWEGYEGYVHFLRRVGEGGKGGGESKAEDHQEDVTGVVERERCWWAERERRVSSEERVEVE